MPRLSKHLSIVLALASLSALFAACSTTRHPYSSLSNQGILAVSPDNPRLGSNLFLGSEASQSPNLYQFLETRGAPAAIEILQDPLAPTRFIMFYPDDRQVYMAVLREPDELTAREWIISGPFGIQRSDLRTTGAMSASLRGGPAPFLINGRVRRFYAGDYDRPTRRLAAALPTPTPIPTPKIKRPVKTPAPIVDKDAARPDELDPAKFKPLTLDQQAIAISKGFAERAENGDVIHTVQDPHETLQIIAKWYTSTAANALSIAALNGLEENATLPQGARIRIPLRIVKKLKAMPPGYN